MDHLDVLFGLVVGAIVVVVLTRTVGEPLRTGGGMWRFRLPGWPTGVQEDDDARWSWSGTRKRTPPEPVADDLDPTDTGIEDLEVTSVRYEVRSPDRARS